MIRPTIIDTRRIGTDVFIIIQTVCLPIEIISPASIQVFLPFLDFKAEYLPIK